MIDYLLMLWNELLLFFNIGITIKIKITLKCNLHCSYCCITIADGHRAKYEELTVDEWVKVVENFPLKVRKVILIGGEPFYRNDAPELVNRLTAKHIIVKAESNGLYNRILDIKPTPFFKIITTFHHEMTEPQRKHWKLIRDEIAKRYRIRTCEIVEGEISGTQLMPLVSAGDEGCYYRRDFIFTANGELKLCIQDVCMVEGYRPKVNWQYGAYYSVYDMSEKFRIMVWNNLRSKIYRLIGREMGGW